MMEMLIPTLQQFARIGNIWGSYSDGQGATGWPTSGPLEGRGLPGGALADPSGFTDVC